ncbi:hypothetical protein ACUXV3_01320 [Roseobacteraceae bacterium NS-SX3]
MRIFILSLCSLPLLAACDGVQLNSSILNGSAAAPQSAPAGTEPAATEAEAAAPEAGSGAGYSGSATTVAALGDPSVPGLWMETPLVGSEQRARVRGPSGAEVTLLLKPIPGEATAGSRLSIEAMRALGAPVTELVEVQVLPAV